MIKKCTFTKLIISVGYRVASRQASIGYTQAWLKGDINSEADGGAHVHEGLRLLDGSGWVGIGDTNILGAGDKTGQVKYIFKNYRVSKHRVNFLFQLW